MPIHKMPQEKSKTELFGDLFGSIMGGYTEGKLRKKKQAQDDAMRIWQMAQYDPFVLSSPLTAKTFGAAGYPVPTPGRPYRERKIIKGKDFYYMVDPYTGQITKTNIPAPVTLDPYAAMFGGGSPEMQGLINELREEEGLGVMPGLTTPGLGQVTKHPAAEEPFVGPPKPPKQVKKPLREAPNRLYKGFGGAWPTTTIPTKTTPSVIPRTQGKYKIGDEIERGGNRYKVVGFDTDGEPLVEKI